MGNMAHTNLVPYSKLSTGPMSVNQDIDILIVDDTIANLQLLAGMLKEDGYKVRPASSGKIALEAIAKKAPDLILLDIKMPEMDGYEVCSRKVILLPTIFQCFL